MLIEWQIGKKSSSKRKSILTSLSSGTEGKTNRFKWLFSNSQESSLFIFSLSLSLIYLCTISSGFKIIRSFHFRMYGLFGWVIKISCLYKQTNSNCKTRMIKLRDEIFARGVIVHCILHYSINRVWISEFVILIYLNFHTFVCFFFIKSYFKWKSFGKTVNKSTSVGSQQF